MAQVGSSLEKKVTAEKVRPHPRAASSVSRSGGRLKGKKLLILTLTPEKEVIHDLASNISSNGTPTPNLRKKVKTCVIKLYKTDYEMSESDITTHETDEFTAGR
jgi:hypothetical protein